MRRADRCREQIAQRKWCHQCVAASTVFISGSPLLGSKHLDAIALTIPHLHTKGEFIGGSDSMMDIHESGGLLQVIAAK